jgi:hypothetical protein
MFALLLALATSTHCPQANQALERGALRSARTAIDQCLSRGGFTEEVHAALLIEFGAVEAKLGNDADARLAFGAALKRAPLAQPTVEEPPEVWRVFLEVQRAVEVSIPVGYRQGRQLYEKLDFERAGIRFQSAARQAGLTPEVRAGIWMWAALSFLQIEEAAAARQAMKDALTARAGQSLPALAPPGAEDLLFSVRKELGVEPVEEASPEPAATAEVEPRPVVSDDGFDERRRLPARGILPALLVTGVVLGGMAYAGALFMGSMLLATGTSVGGLVLIPVAGPFILAGVSATSSALPVILGLGCGGAQTLGAGALAVIIYDAVHAVPDDDVPPLLDTGGQSAMAF